MPARQALQFHIRVLLLATPPVPSLDIFDQPKESLHGLFQSREERSVVATKGWCQEDGLSPLLVSWASCSTPGFSWPAVWLKSHGSQWQICSRFYRCLIFGTSWCTVMRLEEKFFFFFCVHATGALLESTSEIIQGHHLWSEQLVVIFDHRPCGRKIANAIFWASPSQSRSCCFPPSWNWRIKGAETLILERTELQSIMDSVLSTRINLVHPFSAARLPWSLDIAQNLQGVVPCRSQWSRTLLSADAFVAFGRGRGLLSWGLVWPAALKRDPNSMTVFMKNVKHGNRACWYLGLMDIFLSGASS